MTEDPIITQLRVADEKILAEMEKTVTDFEKYNGLVTKRHKIYLEYENRATDNTTRYLISTIRQNILTQIKVSVLEVEIVKLSIRVDNLETKTYGNKSGESKEVPATGLDEYDNYIHRRQQNQPKQKKSRKKN